MFCKCRCIMVRDIFMNKNSFNCITYSRTLALSIFNDACSFIQISFIININMTDSIEMLNCLQITDVSQLPALIHPTQTVFVGPVPESYQWSLNTLENIGQTEIFEQVESLQDVAL